MGDNLRPISLDRLRPNHVLRFPIRDPRGVLLLASGGVLTPQLISALRQRGMSTVLADRREPLSATSLQCRGALMEVPAFRAAAPLPVQTIETRRLDQLIEKGQAEWPREIEAAASTAATRRGAVPYDSDLLEETARKQEINVAVLRSTITELRSQSQDALESPNQILDEYLGLMAEDLDLLAGFASATGGDAHPYRHSLNVAMLSLAMGRRVALDEKRLRILGLAAMLHDSGMLLVSNSAWMDDKPLSVTHRLEVMQHSIHVVDLLEKIKAIPEEVRVICYQVHERASGKGYPRGCSGDSIHPLAQIVGLADVYLAMISDRPHRAAILPYKALEAILVMARRRWFLAWPLRALIETTSLFPVGSYVELSDHRIGKIVRSNGSEYARPVVLAWGPEEELQESTGELIDLAGAEGLSILNAATPPRR